MERNSLESMIKNPRPTLNLGLLRHCIKQSSAEWRRTAEAQVPFEARRVSAGGLGVPKRAVRVGGSDYSLHREFIELERISPKLVGGFVRTILPRHAGCSPVPFPFTAIVIA